MQPSIIIVLSLFYALVPAQFLTNSGHQDECTTGTDCASSPGQNCCMKVRDPSDSSKYMKCMPMGVPGSVCDLDGLAEDACPCEVGLTCAKIDLSDFGPTAAGVNPIFEKYHFGLCEMPSEQAR